MWPFEKILLPQNYLSKLDIFWLHSTLSNKFNSNVLFLNNSERFSHVIFIFSHFDWMCCDCTEGVCMHVCVYVCVCDSDTAQTDGWISMKFSTHDLTDICEVLFSRILKVRNWWRHGGHYALFLCSILTVVTFVRLPSKFNIR